jgi:hypothetical protein
MINRFKCKNAVTNQGLTSILGVNFLSDLQEPNWYIGLIDNGLYSGVSNDDTLDNHPGWFEYLGPSTNREEWAATPGLDPGNIYNALPTVITINPGHGSTIKGIFVCDNQLLNVGILWATSVFGTPIVVNDNDELRLFYEVQAERG